MIKKVALVSILIALFALTFSQVSMVNAAKNMARPTSAKPKPTPKPKPTAPKNNNHSNGSVFIGASRIFSLN